MQAIQTRFLGPTNNRGSRYKATCEAGTLTLESDHRLGSEENHVRVARALITKLGWFHDAARGDTYGEWFYGGTPDGYTFVCTVKYAKVTNPHELLCECCGEPAGEGNALCPACQESK
jgi:hypothetical protein